MIALLIALAVVLSAGLVTILLATRNAPEGAEVHCGFHSHPNPCAHCQNRVCTQHAAGAPVALSFSSEKAAA